MRRAAKPDANQSALIELFRAAGASVYVIKEPVDLLVGYMGLTCAVEVKNPNRRGKRLKQRTDQQVEFFANFRGMKAEVRTDEDCISLLSDMRECSQKALRCG
jgi:hypothetical protein